MINDESATRVEFPKKVTDSNVSYSQMPTGQYWQHWEELKYFVALYLKKLLSQLSLTLILSQMLPLATVF